MNGRYRVTLTPEEKQELKALVAGGTARVRHLERARILWRFGVDGARQKLGKAYPLAAQAAANKAAACNKAAA